MRSYLFIFPLFILSGCASEPSWYTNRTLTSQPYEYIGYGSGKDNDTATQNALSEIANHLSVHISSQSTTKTALVNQKATFDQLFIKRLSSDVTLAGLDRLKYENNGDAIYVAYRYSKLPLAEQLKQQGYTCETSSNYLHQTPLFLELQNTLGCPIKARIDFKHGVWLLVADQNIFPLNTSLVSKLFAPIYEEHIIISPSLSEITDSQPYHINLSTDKRGYLSLYLISDYGEVQTLINNRIVTSPTKFVYPDLDRYDGVISELKPSQNTGKALIIALVCGSRFYAGNIDTINEEANVELIDSKFPLLLQQMEKCTFSSSILSIYQQS